jgi:hypothetical protein
LNCRGANGLQIRMYRIRPDIVETQIGLLKTNYSLSSYQANFSKDPNVTFKLENWAATYIIQTNLPATSMNRTEFSGQIFSFSRSTGRKYFVTKLSCNAELRLSPR